MVAGSGRQEVEGGEPAHQGGPILKAAIWRSENITVFIFYARNPVTCRLVRLNLNPLLFKQNEPASIVHFEPMIAQRTCTVLTYII